MPDTFKTSATGEGLIAFLNYSIQKGYLKVATGNAMKTAVREVLAATEGDNWEQIDLNTIDVEDALRRFETLRAMKFSTGSLNTYKGRFRRAFIMFAEFRASPGAWRPNVKQRTRVPSKSVGSPLRPSPPLVVQSSADPGTRAVAPETSVRPAIITYPFPLRDGVLATLELPADLTRREAQRIAAFVGSLAVDDSPERPVAE